MKARVLVSIAALALGACAQIDGGGDRKEWVDRTYRTGSNIPSKNSPEAEGVGVMTRDDVDKWRSQSPPGVPCNTHMGCGSPH
jgi:hypothetical protein